MSPTKAALVAEILAVYALTRWRLPRNNLEGVLGLIRRGRASATGPADIASAEEALVATRLGAAVRRTLRILPTDSRCLTEALVLCSVLSARGIPHVVVIGTRPAPRFSAHAWVECGGRAVLPPYEFGEYRLLEL